MAFSFYLFPCKFSFSPAERARFQISHCHFPPSILDPHTGQKFQTLSAYSFSVRQPPHIEHLTAMSQSKNLKRPESSHRPCTTGAASTAGASSMSPTSTTCTYPHCVSASHAFSSSAFRLIKSSITVLPFKNHNHTWKRRTIYASAKL